MMDHNASHVFLFYGSIIPAERTKLITYTMGQAVSCTEGRAEESRHQATPTFCCSKKASTDEVQVSAALNRCGYEMQRTCLLLTFENGLSEKGREQEKQPGKKTIIL